MDDATPIIVRGSMALHGDIHMVEVMQHLMEDMGIINIRPILRIPQIFMDPMALAEGMVVDMALAEDSALAEVWEEGGGNECNPAKDKSLVATAKSAILWQEKPGQFRLIISRYKMS